MKNRNAFKLYLSSAISKTGDTVFDYVNSIVLVSASNASINLAIYQSTQVLVGIFFNMIGGVMSDQYDKKKILIFGNVFSGITCIFASFFINSYYSTYVLIFANIILALAFSITNPSNKAIIPFAIRGEEELEKYNSIYNIILDMVRLISPLVGIFLLMIFSSRISMLLNGISFIVCAIIISTLDMPKITVTKKNQKVKINYFKNILDSYKYLKDNFDIFLIIILSSALNFFLSGYHFVLPFQKEIYFFQNINYFGTLLVIESIGGIIGGGLFKKIKKMSNNYNPYLLTFFMGATLSFSGLAFLWKMQYLGMFFIFCFSFIMSLFNINFFMTIQMKVEKEYIGRVFSLILTIILCFIPMGTFFFSLFFPRPTLETFSIIGGCIVLLSILFFILSRCDFDGKNRKYR